MVLIKGGQVVDPKRQEAFLADVVLGDGKIVGIGVMRTMERMRR